MFASLIWGGRAPASTIEWWFFELIATLHITIPANFIHSISPLIANFINDNNPPESTISIWHKLDPDKWHNHRFLKLFVTCNIFNSIRVPNRQYIESELYENDMRSCRLIFSRNCNDIKSAMSVMLLCMKLCALSTFSILSFMSRCFGT